MTLLQRINRIRQLDAQRPIEDVKVNNRYLVQREVRPFDAPSSMVTELVPAAKDVR